MKTEIRNRPAFANLLVEMQPGDRFVAEAGAMASMSSGVSLSTRWNGGFLNAVLRRIFVGETLFMNEYAAEAAGHVVLTQPFPGDMIEMPLRGNTMYLQPGAFIAAEPGVQLGVSWAGIKSLISGEGLFRLKVSGQGRVWFGAYGAIFSREINGELIVDSGHLVAYEPTVGIRPGLAGGIFSSFFGGEGVVIRVSGQGRIYMQSRSFSGLAAWVNSHL
jgi:uncharacterized protein (TIGR00266 family)